MKASGFQLTKDEKVFVQAMKILLERAIEEREGLLAYLCYDMLTHALELKNREQFITVLRMLADAAYAHCDYRSSEVMGTIGSIAHHMAKTKEQKS